MKIIEFIKKLFRWNQKKLQGANLPEQTNDAVGNSLDFDDNTDMYEYLIRKIKASDKYEKFVALEQEKQAVKEEMYEMVQEMKNR